MALLRVLLFIAFIILWFVFPNIKVFENFRKEVGIQFYLFYIFLLVDYLLLSIELIMKYK